MMTAEEIIHEIERLPPEEQWIIKQYCSSGIHFAMEEDHDLHVDEDIAEAGQIKLEEAAEGLKPVPFREMWERTQQRLREKKVCMMYEREHRKPSS